MVCFFFVFFFLFFFCLFVFFVAFLSEHKLCCYYLILRVQQGFRVKLKNHGFCQPIIVEIYIQPLIELGELMQHIVVFATG